MFFFFSLIAACAFRYNGLSFVYLIYLLLIPLFSEPTKTTMQGKMFVTSFFRISGGHSMCLCVVEREVLSIFPSLSELTCDTYCKFSDTAISLYAGSGAEGLPTMIPFLPQGAAGLSDSGTGGSFLWHYFTWNTDMVWVKNELSEPSQSHPVIDCAPGLDL